MLNLFPTNHTWRGFFLNVATIAIAALIILGAINLFEYLYEPHPAHSLKQDSPKPSPESAP